MRYLLRTGFLGTVGWFDAADLERRERGAMVLCRTERGTEVGQVLACEDGGPARQVAGDVIRPLTAPDERQLWANHARRMQAMEMAESLFKRLRISASLVDAELLFDRQQFCFYVLGNLEPNTTTLVETLREQLAADVQFVSLKTAEASQCGGGCDASRCGTCPASDKK